MIHELLAIRFWRILIKFYRENMLRLYRRFRVILAEGMLLDYEILAVSGLLAKKLSRLQPYKTRQAYEFTLSLSGAMIIESFINATTLGFGEVLS